MDTREKILSILARGPSSGADLARRLRMTRQAVHLHLKALCREGRAHSTGRTRGAVFHAGTGTPDRSLSRFARRLPLARLEEDRVFDEASSLLQFERRLRPNVLAIVRYAFTEILNNAIDHSRAKQAEVTVELDAYDCSFLVRDRGIGVFTSIRSSLGLPDEPAAAAQLLKGKTTTAPDRHTGQGIFFTSKAGDHFVLRSHRLAVEFGGKPGVLLREIRLLEGTEARFRVSRTSRRILRELFDEFAPEEADFRFERTRVLVRLQTPHLTSRSEARRLLAGLEKFRKVSLDFRGVKSLGQGFADEVFRVFRRTHPSIELTTRNVSPSLNPMIRQALDDSVSRSLTKA